MTVSEAVRQQVIDYSGSMTAVEIAKRLGIGRATVQRIQKANGASPKASKQNDAPQSTASKPEPTHARERRASQSKQASKASKTIVQQTEPEVYLAPIRDLPGQGRTTPVSPSDVAMTLLQHLNSEIELYERAKRRLVNEDDKQMAWEVVNHERLVQSNLMMLAKWFGMDKGDLLHAVEEIRNDPLAHMTKDELLALYNATSD